MTATSVGVADAITVTVISGVALGAVSVTVGANSVAVGRGVRVAVGRGVRVNVGRGVRVNVARGTRVGVLVERGVFDGARLAVARDDRGANVPVVIGAMSAGGVVSGTVAVSVFSMT